MGEAYICRRGGGQEPPMLLDGHMSFGERATTYTATLDPGKSINASQYTRDGSLIIGSNNWVAKNNPIYGKLVVLKKGQSLVTEADGVLYVARFEGQTVHFTLTNNSEEEKAVQYGFRDYFTMQE